MAVSKGQTINDYANGVLLSAAREQAVGIRKATFIEDAKAEHAADLQSIDLLFPEDVA